MDSTVNLLRNASEVCLLRHHPLREKAAIGGPALQEDVELHAETRLWHFNAASVRQDYVGGELSTFGGFIYFWLLLTVRPAPICILARSHHKITAFKLNTSRYRMSESAFA